MADKNGPERVSSQSPLRTKSGKKQQKKKPVRTSPVKIDVAEDERYCQCDVFMQEELSLACETCDDYWHYSCAGLEGLTEEMGACLVNWRCPNCFISPHTRRQKTQTATPDSDDIRAIRNVVREELEAMTPVIRATVEDVVKRSSPSKPPSMEHVEKAVTKAVKSYAEMTAQTQKKVIDELSASQSTKEVVEQVTRSLDSDRIERDRKKHNLCILMIPESKKKSPKEREEDDLKFCVEVLEITLRDIKSCHRAGKKSTDPSFRRPLIIVVPDEEAANFYTMNGKGYKTNYEVAPNKYAYINRDLCKADRTANFRIRQAKEERRKKEVAGEKTEEKRTANKDR